MIIPLLPNYCHIAPRLSFSSQEITDQKIIFLKSFPDQSLILPPRAYFFTSNPHLYGNLDRNKVLKICIDYLHQALVQLDLLNKPEPPKLLLVLPDKTRTAIASHLLVDAVLKLKKQYSNLEFTLLFGLGTHPPMTQSDLFQWLSKERYEALQKLGIPLRQQSTLAPLQPQEKVMVEDIPAMEDVSARSFAALNQSIAKLEDELNLAISKNQSLELGEYLFLTEEIYSTQNKFEQVDIKIIPQKKINKLKKNLEYSLSLPAELWQHHLTIIAGDTELHPYEGRGGSGGINKMLVVGLANIETIQRTHSTKILLHPQTRVGQSENAFVHSLDYLAKHLEKTLLDEKSMARTRPLGISIASLKDKQINGLWLGQNESKRQQLAKIVTESRTVYLSEPVHIVIADANLKKGTDILAGARALQYLCEWDDQNNPLLADTPRQRVALLFNPCYEKQNHGGIGNHGTKKQLDVLQQLIKSTIPKISQELPHAQNLEQALGILRSHRRGILMAWTHHLQLVSEINDFLTLVENLVLISQELISLGLNNKEAEECLQSTLATYANDYSDQGKSIQQLLDIYTAQNNLNMILEKVNELQEGYQENEGLGEGGQRVLRFLNLLYKFETFLLATDNAIVLDYLGKLDPNLKEYLSPTLKKSLTNKNLHFGILGITGLNLSAHNAQQCLEIALNYADYYNCFSTNLKIAFLQEALIIHST